MFERICGVCLRVLDWALVGNYLPELKSKVMSCVQQLMVVGMHKP